ncbi:MAG: hypothetical protein ACI4KA_09730 [Oscillospiraceae bacterium]
MKKYYVLKKLNKTQILRIVFDHCSDLNKKSMTEFHFIDGSVEKSSIEFKRRCYRHFKPCSYSYELAFFGDQSGTVNLFPCCGSVFLDFQYYDYRDETAMHEFNKELSFEYLRDNDLIVEVAA